MKGVGVVDGVAIKGSNVVIINVVSYRRYLELKGPICYSSYVINWSQTFHIKYFKLAKALNELSEVKTVLFIYLHSVTLLIFFVYVIL
jgi:hypothetical protein